MMLSLRTADCAALAAALVAFVALLAGGFADCAAAATFDPSHLAADRLAEVEQLCEANLHLHPGELHFDSCVAGLSESLASATRADTVVAAREACFKEWTIPGSPDLGECLLGASQGRPGPSTAPSPKSYFRASPQDIRRGEQLSCARLGFDPIGGAFEACVANLASALGSADPPSN